MSIAKCKSYPAYKESGIQWLKEIPEQWEVKPLKYIASTNDEALGEDTDPNFEMTYIDIGSVDSVNGITKKETLLFGIAPSRARRIVRDGDVIISTVRTYLRAIAAIENAETGLTVSTGFAVIRPRKSLVSRFAKYALHAPYFVERVVAESVGVSYPAINESLMSSFAIALPSLNGQHAIAAFLDRQTAKIDALVAKKEQLIELLQENRTALITHAVTKGVDPTVPMKDSGVEWLGQIPAPWNFKRNKILFWEIDVRSVAGEEELLTVSHITGVTRRSEKEVYMIEAESHEGYKLCKAGDLVINTMWAWMGALGIASEDGMVSPSYNVYRFKLPNLLPRYYDYLSRIPAHIIEITRHSKGVWTSRLRLYPEEFFEIHTIVPDLREQEAIIDFLDYETAKIDALVAKVHEGIERLKEYRTALISAAVTGKIDVRTS